MSLSEISIIGLGKLGLPLAACFAYRGFQVVGVDINPVRVEEVNNRQSPLQEPGLQELLDSIGDRLVATTDFRTIADTEVTIILVPTPSSVDGSFSNNHILLAYRELKAAISGKDEHLVVISSTVMPGSCSGQIREMLGPDLDLCYGPSFVALGEVLKGFLEPDWLLIGSDDESSADKLKAIYQRLCFGEPPIATMSLINAEITKLALNTFLTTKITFANTIARLCENIPGANVDTVVEAIGLDSRISPAYLKGAVAYGGPCFVRDNLAMFRAGLNAGLAMVLPNSVHLANKQQNTRLVQRVLSEVAKTEAEGRGRVVGILGLSYKPNTDITEHSVGLGLLRRLRLNNIECYACDPLVKDELFVELEDLILYSSVIVVTTACPEFRNLEFGPGQTVIDCWRYLDGDRIKTNGARYIALGVGPI